MKRLYGVSLFAVAMVCAAGSAYAQQAGTVPSPVPTPPPSNFNTPAQAEAVSRGAQPTLGQGDIIVTATKRSESINRVPLTISAISGTELSNRGIKDVADLQRIVPGFVAVQTNVGPPSYFLRGVGYYNFSFVGRPTVTLYQDETPLPYQAMAQGTDLDLERVEVLKGPQGTVFGSNSTGGAINFIAAKPTSRLSAGMSASFGRFNENVVNGFISGPLGDTVGVRIAASHTGMGDWQKSYTRDDTLGSKDITEGRFIINAHLGELRLETQVSGVLDHSDTVAGQLTDTTGGRPNVVAYPLAPHNARAADWSDCLTIFCKQPKNDNYQVHASFRADYDVSDALTLTSLTGYTYTNERYAQDSDGMTLDITNYYVSGTMSSISQELRATGKFSTKGSWIVGANYERDKAFEDQHGAAADGVSAHAFDGLGLPVLDDFNAVARTKDTAKAIFANVDYELLPRLTAHAGSRYTWTGSDFTGCAKVTGVNHTNNIGLATAVRNPILATLPQGACYSLVADAAGVLQPSEINKSIREHNFSWRGSLDYKPFAGTMIYGSVARGYKAGQFGNLQAPFGDQYTPVKQEQLTAYEIGLKSAVIPNLLQLNGAFFYYDYENKQVQGRVQFPIFGFIQALVTVPKSRVEGGEFEAVLRPYGGLTLSVSGTYADTKITGSFVGFTTFGVRQELKGSHFPYTPKFSLEGNAEYKWRLNHDLGAFVQANVTHRSKAYGDFVPDPRLMIPNYTVVDATAGITKGNWRFQLYGRNLFNEYYWTSALRSQQAVFHTAAMPTTYGASVAYKF